jgi:hypothetical protein
MDSRILKETASLTDHHHLSCMSIEIRFHVDEEGTFVIPNLCLMKLVKAPINKSYTPQVYEVPN